MNSVLQILGFNINPSFEQIFSRAISQKVLWYYWDGIVRAQNVGLFMLEMTQKDLLREITRRNPRISPKQAIYLTGLILLARDGNGLRELRGIVCRETKDRTWSRIKKEYTHLMEQISINKTRDWIHQIENAFKEYKPLTEPYDGTRIST